MSSIKANRMQFNTIFDIKRNNFYLQTSLSAYNPLKDTAVLNDERTGKCLAVSATANKFHPFQPSTFATMQQWEVYILRSKSLRHNPLVRHKNRLASFKLFLYVLPGILLILLFHYVPLWGWSFAFFRYKPGLDLAQCPFVGLENFTLLFSNPIMRNNLFRVLRNTFGIHLLGYLFSPLPMLFAVFLSELSSKRYQKIVQVVTTLPNFISWVIMFSLASSLFGSTGLINTLLSNAGVSTRINLLNSDEHVWLTQVLLQTWKNTGWSAIIYFSALAGISPDLYEAAMVDGASRMQRIWHITLPGLIPTYFVLLIISIGNFLNTGIDQYMAFGNALNKEYIEVLDLYTYNLGIGSGQISFGVAVGIMKSVVALVLFSMANIASKKVRGTSVF